MLRILKTMTFAQLSELLQNLIPILTRRPKKHFRMKS
jgi:hypothetical protein